MKVELLYFEGCAGFEALRRRLSDLPLDAQVELRRIESEQEAADERFLGSPTLRIDGCDVEPGAELRRDFGLKCRLYRSPDGYSNLPLDSWIIAATERARTTG